MPKLSYQDLENELIKVKKEYSESAKKKELEYRALFDSIPNLVDTIELIYNENLEPIDWYIRDINEAFAKFLGKTREELIDAKLTSIIGKIESYWLTAISSVQETGKPISFSNYGAEFDKYYHVTAWKISTKLIGLTFTDITISEKAKIELEEAKKRAEESDKLKSAFLSNISHEIRTPMNGILGFTELLKKKNLSDDKRDTYLNLLDLEGHRLLNFVSDIVDLSEIDSDVVSVNSSSCDVNALIDFLYTRYSINVIEDNIILLPNKSCSDTKYNIKTDTNKLIQIMSNLIENAIKFTQEGVIEFGYTHRDENNIKFYVKDTGIGIGVDEQETIFERFRQGKNHETHNHGVGLGLSIVKGLSTVLGGKVEVKSTLGVGSMFSVSIPHEKTIARKEITNVKPIEKNNVKSDDLDHFTVLVVEDEYIIFMFLKECLLDFNCTVLYASDGEKAVEIFKETPSIDLILMDISMPKMNGYQALQKIRELDENILIIAQTGLVMPSDKEKMLNSGFNDYIFKPISLSTLTKTINKHLNIQRIEE